VGKEHDFWPLAEGAAMSLIWNPLNMIGDPRMVIGPNRTGMCEPLSGANLIPPGHYHDPSGGILQKYMPEAQLRAAQKEADQRAVEPFEAEAAEFAKLVPTDKTGY
jgi:hypothetical protein